MNGEECIHVVGVGVGVRLVGADEDEESRADRRYYSPLYLRPNRRSIQGRFRTNCSARCTEEGAHLDAGREDTLHHSPHPVYSSASATPSGEGRPDESPLAGDRPRSGGGSSGGRGS